MLRIIRFPCEAAMTSIQAIADRLAISDILIRYGTALDTANWELLASCFTADGRPRAST